MAEPITVLYRDEAIVAVHKPAGLLVHRREGPPYDGSFALQMVRDQIRQRVYPVHRLDRPTSGVLVFALSPHAARALVDAFATGQVVKRYLAVVRGFTEPQGVVDYPLHEHPGGPGQRSEHVRKAAQPAITAYRRLATAELPFATKRYPTSRYSLVEAYPRTGRTHQIRRHMKHICHPVIGDTTHGDGSHNRLFRERLDCRRLLLTAGQISMPHPGTGRLLTITAPLDEGFRALIRALNWDCPGAM